MVLPQNPLSFPLATTLLDALLVPLIFTCLSFPGLDSTQGSPFTVCEIKQMLGP